MAVKNITERPVPAPTAGENPPSVNQTRVQDAAVDSSERVVREDRGPDTGAFHPGKKARLQGAKPISNSFLQAVGGSLKVKRNDPECGIQLEARIGVPGDQVPPPPPLLRLEGLRRDEAAVQREVVDAVEKDPDGFARAYLERVHSGVLGPTNVFGVDDAKLLFPQYNHSRGDPELTKAAMARYNTVVHQAAAAVAKRTFLLQLDTLKPGDQVMVTNGGCGAGKSYALSQFAGGNSSESALGHMGAIWDAAGEAGGTENKWILDECRKRGLEVTYVYVHANPFFTWDNEERGVITRAERKGRMVNALSYAESYVLGARNFAAFHETYRDADDVHFLILDNRRPKPQQLSELPQEALEIDGEELYGHALETLRRRRPGQAILRGGTISRDIWGERYA